MPKKIDQKVKERCVRQVLEHLPEYPSLMAAAEAVARREGVGKESVRRWVVQAQIDVDQRQGATTEELAQIKSSRPRSAGWRKTYRSWARLGRKVTGCFADSVLLTVRKRTPSRSRASGQSPSWRMVNLG